MVNSKEKIAALHIGAYGDSHFQSHCYCHGGGEFSGTALWIFQLWPHALIWFYSQTGPQHFCQNCSFLHYHLFQSAGVPLLHLQSGLFFASPGFTWGGYIFNIHRPHYIKSLWPPFVINIWPGPLQSLCSPWERNSGLYSSKPSGHAQVAWSMCSSGTITFSLIL